MRVHILGCGDAFGAGGRFNTCFHLSQVAGAEGAALIDCGATSLVAMRRFGVDPNGVGTVFLSHLHGDHFGGLPWLILDAQHVSGRRHPLVIAGPEGTQARLAAAMEALYPGSSTAQRAFTLDFVALAPGRETQVGAFEATPFPVSHPSGAPSLALRLAGGGKVVAFTGDTEWVDDLVPLGRGADLLIAECWRRAGPVRFHLDWETLAPRLPGIGARRVLLTHLGPEMLAHAATDAFRLEAGPDCTAAEDGMAIGL